jgi:hypothetical protein
MSTKQTKIFDKYKYEASSLFQSGTENQYTCQTWRKYNGKEKQTEFNLNWLDYGARMPARQRFCHRQNKGGYNPAIRPWGVTDHFSSKTQNLILFRYAFKV